MDGEWLAWLAQSTPAEWSIAKEALKGVTEIARQLGVVAVLLLLTWAWFTERIVLGSELRRSRGETDEWKQEAHRAERMARHGVEALETTAKAVEK